MWSGSDSRALTILGHKIAETVQEPSVLALCSGSCT
ncbi:hypothetical protein CASFOL_010999 [Castilleja foliolosa]|uniref:Uncharacterized protein n=1 Tax=Castilleja foliolosa TaxID=1961234 RepID=A0ABD3DYA5_9LAMI